VRRLALAWLAMALLLAGAAAAKAVEPDEMLSDPALEARARDISREIRCLVCQNQSIDDSNADLARDLRLLIRERLVIGDSDDAVRRYLTDRYGEFVLLRPPVKPATYALWFGPLALLAMGGLAVMLYLRRRGRAQVPPGPLNEAERQRLARLFDRADGGA
jgi:cytochrome c-type biogenesis protein CcmH